jgi:hypothetical protein
MLPESAGASGKPGRPGPPLFLSYPHYCQADERLQQGVEGISCDPSKHDLFLDVGERGSVCYYPGRCLGVLCEL